MAAMRVVHIKWCAWVAMLVPALCLTGCGTLVRDGLVHSYMGIPFDASQTSPEIAELARRSLEGDKQAQLDLGIAFEEGHGVEQDLDKARKLYQLAASESGGPIWVYVPGVNGSAGRVMQVDAGPGRPGLRAAGERLVSLTGGRSGDVE